MYKLSEKLFHLVLTVCVVIFTSTTVFAEGQVCLSESEARALIDFIDSSVADSDNAGACSTNATKPEDCSGCATRGECRSCCQNIDENGARQTCYAACPAETTQTLRPSQVVE